ncbi:MAG: hypothetical protein A2Y12_06805 [Planctomycetes bacterium GWF2_42_9]|nr:MAG: hypothetical protein A2Y12_06805 [Planctomycetes bacterium GWF2_42_9]
MICDKLQVVSKNHCIYCTTLHRIALIASIYARNQEVKCILDKKVSQHMDGKRVDYLRSLPVRLAIIMFNIQQLNRLTKKMKMPRLSCIETARRTSKKQFFPPAKNKIQKYTAISLSKFSI